MAGHPYLVVVDADAFIEFESLRGREERKATFNALDKLRQLGPNLVPPHASKLKGEPDLMELRPRQGRSQVRPIYPRIADGEYVVLAFAIAADKADFEEAVKNARVRLVRYRA